MITSLCDISPQWFCLFVVRTRITSHLKAPLFCTMRKIFSLRRWKLASCWEGGGGGTGWSERMKGRTWNGHWRQSWHSFFPGSLFAPIPPFKLLCCLPALLSASAISAALIQNPGLCFCGTQPDGSLWEGRRCSRVAKCYSLPQYTIVNWIVNGINILEAIHSIISSISVSRLVVWSNSMLSID